MDSLVSWIRYQRSQEGRFTRFLSGSQKTGIGVHTRRRSTALSLQPLPRWWNYHRWIVDGVLLDWVLIDFCTTEPTVAHHDLLALYHVFVAQPYSGNGHELCSRRSREGFSYRIIIRRGVCMYMVLFSPNHIYFSLYCLRRMGISFCPSTDHKYASILGRAVLFRSECDDNFLVVNSSWYIGYCAGL